MEIEVIRAKKRINELNNGKNTQIKDLKFKIQKINERLNGK